MIPDNSANCPSNTRPISLQSNPACHQSINPAKQQAPLSHSSSVQQPTWLLSQPTVTTYFPAASPSGNQLFTSPPVRQDANQSIRPTVYPTVAPDTIRSHVTPSNQLLHSISRPFHLTARCDLDKADHRSGRLSVKLGCRLELQSTAWLTALLAPLPQSNPPVQVDCPGIEPEQPFSLVYLSNR